ncbi:hypothetical protein PPYR_02333 [Photinus pyralis]|uniref:DDE Tnp4 domain-containing protein n=2 Tax=Photinus pyralis TaxID=7054 RepID=A0A5N4B745_PHOPY|nr:hypothetical protein PPYR_02333 [Photinus pyralis]
MMDVVEYLSTGMTFSSLGYEFQIARSTIGTIIRETCEAIWSTLKEQEMPEPTEEVWLGIADQFYLKTNFPNCVGTIDGKHIRCMNPRRGGSNFFNYKKFFSIVLMAVVDANLRFVAIDVGAYGKEGDSTVFRDSPLGKKLYSGSLNLPPPRCLPNTQPEEIPQPFVMVGDEAFKLHTNLLKPYPSRNMNATKRVFNYRLSRCRRNVECAFGVLANKWRIFHTPILVQPSFVDKIVQACCILHNFVRKRDVRDYFAQYFMGAGAVHFQRSYMY